LIGNLHSERNVKIMITYPNQPPKQPEKSIFKEGMQRTDSALGLWMTHDPAIYKDPATNNYYIYCTGAICQRSKDLVSWEMVGKVVDVPPVESSEWVGGTDIWAPDIVKVGDEYRLYCSNSTWGVQQSCIFLAVADNAEGPFIPRGCVLKTSDKLPVNAIDANIITDVATGEMYMLYGSFWGGCHVLRLDKETGLAAEEGIGTCVARRPMWMSGGIEGPYMIYNPDTEYYYLFVSYASLKSDYNVRVGRSKSPLGPFVDYNGRDLTDLNDADNTIGFLNFCGYRWSEGTPYMAPGHNSVLHDTDGSWYIVAHIREKNFTDDPEPSTMQIRKIFWSPDGWPLVSAEPYSGEQEQPITAEDIAGRYERINLVPSLPQGIQTAVPMKLRSDGYYECCSVQGRWEYIGDNRIKITYGPNTDICIVSAVWDHECNRPTLALTGLSDSGIGMWAKRLGDLQKKQVFK